MLNATKSKTSKSTSRIFTIAQLCREHELNPKQIRNKLRNLELKNDDAQKLLCQRVKNVARWTYDVKHRVAICALLKIDDSKRKKS